MKKIENSGVEFILFEEFDFYGYIEEGDAFEEMNIRGIDKPHSVFFGGDDSLWYIFYLIESLDNQFAVETREVVMVREIEVLYGAVAF